MDFNLLSTMEILISHWLSQAQNSIISLTFQYNDNRHEFWGFLPYDFFWVCSIVSGATDMILIISSQISSRLIVQSSLHLRTVRP